MIINHNKNSKNSHRRMKMNSFNAAKSMEKLSSGLRINKAGDDAAGLSISEKMRAQIRGLDQACRNAQDGISLIQTAEGGLNETHSILQRMRELAVQAANDTNTEQDRASIQQEINQLTSEVNRIGNTTEFNTKKLLCCGNAVDETVKNNIIKGLKEGWLESSEKLIENTYGLKGTGTASLKVVISSDAPYGELAHVGGNSSELELYIDASDFEKGDGENGNNIHGKLYNDRILAHEMTHAVMDDSLGAAKMNDMHDKNKVWFIEGTAEGIAGADERVKNVIGTSGAINNSKVDNLVSRAVQLLNGAIWGGDDTDYAAGYVIVKYMQTKLDSGKSMKTLMADIKNSADFGSAALEKAITDNTTASSYSDFVSSFKNDAKGYIDGTGSKHMTLNWGSDETDVGSIAGSDHGGSSLNAESIVNEGTASDTADGQPLQGFNLIWPDEGETASSKVVLQIGANQNQNLTLELQDMTASALGISNVSVSSLHSIYQSDGETAVYTSNLGVTSGTDSKQIEAALDLSNAVNAGQAIAKFQNAIDKVSSFRSKLGAYQNRLEHTINNLQTSNENLTSSESRIRDVDMAKEMMSFSKNNILLQAAQAMLSQVNQQPQAVLQLLR